MFTDFKHLFFKVKGTLILDMNKMNIYWEIYVVICLKVIIFDNHHYPKEVVFSHFADTCTVRVAKVLTSVPTLILNLKFSRVYAPKNVHLFSVNQYMYSCTMSLYFAFSLYIKYIMKMQNLLLNILYIMKMQNTMTLYMKITS